jgi:predicted ATPase
LRAEDAESSPFLKGLAEAQRRGGLPLDQRHLSVGPLTEEEATELALLLLDRNGADAGQQAGVIARESGGSPFFVWELVHYLLSQNQSEAIGEIDLEEMLRHRLDRLPEAAGQLLRAVAVAGKPAAPAILVDAVGQASHDPSLWSRLKAENLIRTWGEGDEKRIEIYHDRIREAILGLMPSQQCRALHARLASAIRPLLQVPVDALAAAAGAEGLGRNLSARAIDQRDWQLAFDLAYHYDEGGFGKRLPYLL